MFLYKSRQGREYMYFLKWEHVIVLLLNLITFVLIRGFIQAIFVLNTYGIKLIPANLLL